MGPTFRYFAMAACAVLPAGAALADTQFVSNGACGSLSPCWATIQEAVEAATVPAEIRILPGTYPDAVDLFELNGQAQGNIELLAVTTMNIPAVGSAVITGPFFSGGEFDGNITIRGLTFQGTNTGVELSTAGGDIALFNLVVTGTDDDGISIDLQDGADLLMQDIAISGSGESGIDFEVAPETGPYTLTLTRITSNNNTAYGMDFAQDLAAIESVVINYTATDLTANNNGNDGILAHSTAGNMSFQRITTNDNQFDGLDLEDALNVTLNQIVANNNGDDGVEVDAEIKLTATNIQVRDNAAVGLLIEGATQDDDNGDSDNILGDVMVTGVTATGNEDGILFENVSADRTLRVRNANLSGNSRSGMLIRPNSDTDGVVNASGNFWGDPSGPTHPDNPGGSGDVVADSDNPIDEATGTIIYDDFLAFAPGSARPVPLLGLPGLLLLMLAFAAIGGRAVMRGRS